VAAQRHGKPFAMIQPGTSPTMTTLTRTAAADQADAVVTRLPPGAVCHVAYVDVKQPDANEVARKPRTKQRAVSHAGQQVKVMVQAGAVELTLPR